MNTFLPYPDFSCSAKCLDRQRLGKQRVEVIQLLRSLLVKGAGWSHHPASKMWRGFEASLALYGLFVCAEWRGRGYADSCMNVIAEIGARYGKDDPVPPPWLGDEAFHASHRSN